ncbi:MAG: cobalamin-binding protein [Pedobacter sp.]|nr:MAG: cobalamin-binding protein [Pedobacter sp.]
MVRMFKDQMGRQLTLDGFPQRIISLVPSITELLIDLGLEKQLVGRTNFCIHPKEKMQAIAKVGGTKTLNIEQIKDLAPDLIIGNKEENTLQDITAIESIAPLWMSDINTIQDALDAIRMIGEMTNTSPEANYLNHLIEAGFKDLKELASVQSTKSVCYCIWKEPYMAAAQDTFINDVLTQIGFKNIFDSSRYPEFEPEQLDKLACDYLFLSSEPYPFKEKHKLKLQEKLIHTQVVLVDGEMFSWYGSRMVKAVGYFFNLQKALF